MNPDILAYNQQIEVQYFQMCEFLSNTIDSVLIEAESKIWHAHPVWFIDGNPVVGYSQLKGGIRLLFWSGQSFDEPILKNEGKFKAAELRFITLKDIDQSTLIRCLEKSKEIQWDYKNIVKRKGELLRLK